MPPRLQRLADRVLRPTDAASLVLFRRCFGALMAWRMASMMLSGGMRRGFTEPPFRFTFAGFGWVPRPPAWAIAVLVGAALAAALLMAFDRVPRLAAGLFAGSSAFLLLIDKANYNNHDYLIALLAGILAAVPVEGSGPQRTSPAWGLSLLRFQVAMPYVFGGIAKLQSDWLFRAQPLKTWFADPSEHLVPAAWLQQSWLPFAVSWGGAILDLAIVPALLWRRTRKLAAVTVVGFHLLNFGLFQIGVFPWLMIAAVGLFLDPDWPHRLRRDRTRRAAHPVPAAAVPRRRIVLALLGAYCAAQLFLPLRHLLYPGNVDWTEQGHTFAWRMKVRDKRGEIRFVAVKPDSAVPLPLSGLLSSLLTDRQQRMMMHDPEMMRQVAAYVAREWRAEGQPLTAVRVITDISFNGRPRQPMIDPKTELSELPPGRPAAEWIAPLRQ